MNQDLTNIRDLKPSMKNLSMIFIVLEMGLPNKTKKGHEVRTCKVADKTGCINISLWNEIGQILQPGDICKLNKGYTGLWKGCLTLYTGEKGEVFKIGEFCLVFTEIPNMSEPNPDFLQPPTTSTKTNENRCSSPTHQPSSGPSVPPNQEPVRGNPNNQGLSSLQNIPFQRSNNNNNNNNNNNRQGTSRFSNAPYPTQPPRSSGSNNGATGGSGNNGSVNHASSGNNVTGAGGGNGNGGGNHNNSNGVNNRRASRR